MTSLLRSFVSLFVSLLSPCFPRMYNSNLNKSNYLLSLICSPESKFVCVALVFGLVSNLQSLNVSQFGQ